MNIITIILLLLSVAAFAGQTRVDVPGTVAGGVDYELSYDNGTFHWLTWGGMYRGTWFHTNDFFPGGYPDFAIEQIEYWFYEHSSYPWDTADFYSEVWHGVESGPISVRLLQRTVTAIHLAPCYHLVDPPFNVEPDFWCLINTEMSAGGWPSVLGDYSQPGDAGHSYFSDDFIVWEPWGEMGEYFIAVTGYIPGEALNTTTWGAVKALF